MKKNIYFLFFAFFCIYSQGQNIQEIQLMHWSSKLGLASDEVISFAQDYKGFLWIGTSNGLNRFDGKSFLNIQLKDQDQNIEIKEILSYKKSIYIFTNDGNYFQINTDSFDQEKLTIDKLQNSDLRNELLQLNGDRLEIYNGVRFKLTTEGTLHINGSRIKGNFNDFYKDTRNRFWISSIDNGIGYWNPVEKKIKYVITTSELRSLYFNLDTPRTGEVSMVEDENGRIWFYRDHETIGFWDYELNTIYTIKNIRNHPYLKGAYKLFSVLIDLEIKSLFSDNSGNLWIGTLFNGMFRVRFKQQPFQFYEFDYSSKEGLADEDISCPTPLKNGDVWIGTWGGGINTLKKENLKSSTPSFEVISPQEGIKGSLQNGFVFPIFEDSKENLWVGSNNGGLHLLLKEDRKVRNPFFYNYNVKQGAILSDSIMNVYEDRKGTIWVATVKGLTRYLPENKIFESKFKELDNPNIFKDLYILSIYEDSNNNLWISTSSQGLYKWNKKNNSIKKIGGFETNSILNIVEESKNSIWLSGLNGLFHYDLTKDKFDFKVSNENFPTDHIESMILGTNRLLWMGTDKGLFTYNISTEKVENINLSTTGIRSNQFTRGVSKDEDGYLYFGTRNGFYRFHPNQLSIEENTLTMFTDLKIDGTSYRNREKRNFLNQDISATSKINLSYGENTFSIDYKILDYYIEDLVIYETSMTKEEEKENWKTTYDTSKSWTDLNEGNYIFKVRKKNTSQISVLNIMISPPWWRNKFVILGFVTLLIGVFYFFTKKKITSEKKKQSESFDKLRFKFFLNIAHEIRTPLTLIKGGIERLKDGSAVNKNYLKELDRVSRNTDRLSRLVNEVLDLKKIERSEINLNLKPINLKGLLESTVDVFNFRENETNLVLVAPKEPIWITSDKQLLESIIYNLISNAIKYSKSNSEIQISLFKSSANQISIQVKDNGYGIKKEEQQLVFERLYQSEDHLKTGTGIGLAIVKQYVHLLKGTIALKSELNKGSVFTITFPYEKQKDELLNTEEQSIIIPKKKTDPTLLIIDDQKELRIFIKEIFEKEYNILEASNGQEGLKLTHKHRPSLIISDVMMPVMNGVEFCQKIRNNISVSHIPIILLTAKTGDEAEIKGLSSGADAYVNKPFSQNVLKSKVNVLIENRKKLIKKYDLSFNQNLAVLASNDLDKKFLEKFEILLEERHEHSDLSIEELASEMAVSVSGLYGKIKSITGSAPVEFVRSYRLKKAAQFLRTTNFSVTEISEKTGFGTQKYFSNIFKKHFGMTPIAYRKNRLS